MKIKLEASGCKCNSLCSENCKNDHTCPSKQKYVEENKEYKLDINKVVYNPGLRFIAKICLNSLWGHFGMRENLRKHRFAFNDSELCSSRGKLGY